MHTVSNNTRVPTRTQPKLLWFILTGTHSEVRGEMYGDVTVDLCGFGGTMSRLRRSRRCQRRGIG